MVKLERKLRLIPFVLIFLGSCVDEELPSISTLPVSEISAYTAIGGGNVTNEGSSTVTKRGICWSVSPTPSITDNFTIDGAGVGSFTSSLVDLKGCTNYFVRAYATNSSGTGYGMAVAFKTLGNLPNATTEMATDLTATSAKIKGKVNPNNLTTIVSFEYGTSSNYGFTVLANQSPIIGDSEISVSAEISGLSKGTTYHVRIKAENELGTSYGQDVAFNTPALPSISTNLFKIINYYSIYTNTLIISEGGAPILNKGLCWSTVPNPTINDAKTNEGPGCEEFISSVSNLNTNITYYCRAFATNIVGTIYGNEISFTLYMNINGPQVTDIDGNVYKSKKIGQQIWLSDNLKSTRFSNGDNIPNITNNNTWILLDSPGYCWYNNDELNKNDYGALYNWYVVNDNRKICPSGWHIPSLEEWSELYFYLSGEDLAGGKMKEQGFSNWTYPNTGADNLSGFTARPGGSRIDDGSFSGIKNEGNWWSLVDIYMHLTYYNEHSSMPSSSKIRGFSIRCLKD